MTPIDETLAESSTSSALLAAVLAAACTLYYAISAYKKKRDLILRPWPKVKGALPVLGNFHQIKSPANLTTKMQEWADEYSKECGLYEMDLAGISYLIVCREDKAKEVLLKRPFKIVRVKKLTGAARSIGADGLFTSEGDHWRSDRRLLAPNFNKNHVDDYMKHMNIVIDRLVEKWRSLSTSAEGAPIAINSDLLSFALDSTALTTLGKDFDTLRSNDSIEAKDLAIVFEKAFSRSLFPFSFWKIPIVGQYLDGLGWARARVLSALSKLVDEHYSEEEKSSNDDATHNTFVRKAVVLSQKDSTLSHERIVGNMLTIFIAGSDSTASTLCSIIQMLASDKTGLQEKLSKEVSLLPKELDTLTGHELQDRLPRLKSFLCEVHRFHSAFPSLFLETNEDIEMFGTTVPKNQNVVIFSRYISSNPYVAAKNVPDGPNGEGQLEFCPSRYLVNDGDKLSFRHPEKNSTSFLMFGHGLRVCPGKAFSDAMLSLVAVALLRNFRMELAPDHEPIGRVTGFAEMPDKDIRVIFSPR